MGNLRILPADIMIEILTRLPIELILECKLVCKSWKNLVSHHPLFPKLHLTRLNHSANSGKLGFLVKSQNHELHYFEYNENHDETPNHSTKRINFTPPFSGFNYYKILGSLNGLVCLYGWYDKAYCICNPVTKEYVMLPTVKRDYGSPNYDFLGGFGYVPSTNEYKVVVLYKEFDVGKVAVYTLGSGKGWRNVGRLLEYPRVWNGNDLQAGVFANGALYWIDDFRRRVYVFALTEERLYEQISLPPLPPKRHDFRNRMFGYLDYFLGGLGGVLYFAMRDKVDITRGKCYDIWLLKKKNDISHNLNKQVEREPLSCWSKEFRLPEKPLATTKSGGLLCRDRSSLVIYDAVSSTSKKLVYIPGVSEVFSHKNTLVSLRELGEDIKIMKSVKIMMTRKRCFDGL